MIRPIRDWVIIQRDDEEQKTDAGLIVPESAQEKMTRGIVLAVGPGVQENDAIADALQEAIDLHGAAEQALPVFVAAARVAVARLRRRAPQVKVGDHVLFGKYTGNEVTVKVNGEPRECVVCRDEELYGVIED